MAESGIKFTQPQTPTMNCKDKFSAMMNRSQNCSNRKVRMKETSVQDESSLPDISPVLMSTLSIQCPFRDIPKCICETPHTEKSVVDIKIVEKIGKRNLPILQDERTCRIFENPELTKPVVAKIHGKILSVEFFRTDLALSTTMTSQRINSPNGVQMINKLIATAKELLLNQTIVLQKISNAIQNDDIRDMNELYMSNFYDMPVLHTRSFCEASAWYEKERGIEARRTIGVLARVVQASTYLAEYIAGVSKLNLSGDSNYHCYSRQMSSYNKWSKRGTNFEFLELILEFVTVVGAIRRSHQFGGLINAIAVLITNVQSAIGFCSNGLSRVYNIFQKIVFGRPLLLCFAPIAGLMLKFANCSTFVTKLCEAPGTSDLSYWKGALNFKPDTCVMEIFIAQIQRFKLDPITTINVSKSLISFSHAALLNQIILWVDKTSRSCNCCLNLLQYVIMSLCECSMIDIDELKTKYADRDFSWRSTKCEVSDEKNTTWGGLFEDWSRLEDSQVDFWGSTKRSQFDAIRKGIRLLSYLAKHDGDFVVRMEEIEDAFHLFLRHIDRIKDLELHDRDLEALQVSAHGAEKAVISTKLALVEEKWEPYEC